MAWHLHLLGVPKAESEGGLGDLPLDKPASLLYYLVQRGDWVSRSELAFLYRPDVPEDLALHTVRKLLHRARTQPWAAALEVETTRLRFAVRTDVQDFQQALERKDWQGALEGYRGEFLEGLTITGAEGYQAWLELERQSLEQQWRLAAFKWTQVLEQRGDYAEATRWLQRLLTRDPLDEETLQAYMRVLHAAGKRKEALEAYQRFRQDLSSELEVEPLEATQALVEAIRQAERSKEKPKEQPSASARAKHNLLSPSTRFIGRRRELDQLTMRLREPDTRLLTLVGLGGVGKTRLALELARQQLESFPGGVYFVPLAGVTSANLLVTSIASAIGFTFSGKGDVKGQLTNFLRDKRLLLLLDNFEHLLTAAPLLSELLEEAPQLLLLVTSRVALELQSEQLFDLRGLAAPPPDTEASLESFDAVRLFLDRAGRRSAKFVISGPTLHATADLCRKVEGLPLALELAASWTRSLSVAEMVNKLEHDLDLLKTTLRDVPKRHRSIRAMLNASWQRLSPQEQEALAKLSVFQGGFTAAAAETVAGAHLALLLSLINRALVRRSSEGRSELHKLVGQYAAEQLSEQLAKKSEVESAFSHYYLGSLAHHAPTLRGPRHLDVLHTLLEDLDNLRAACTIAIAGEDWDPLEEAMTSLRSLFWEASLLSEGKALFEHISRALQTASFADPTDRERLLARARLCLGIFMRDIGLFQEASATLRQSIETFRKLDISGALARALQVLGTIARDLGDFAEAERLLTESLKLCEVGGENLLRAYTLYSLGQLRRFQGHYKEARELLEVCLSIRGQMGDVKGTNLVAANLALLAKEHEGDLSKARHYTERALTVTRQVGNKSQEATELDNLALIAYEEGHLHESERLLRESLFIKQDLGNLYGQMMDLANLGEILREQESYEGARNYFEESLQLGHRLDSARGKVRALAELGETARRQGEGARAQSRFKEMLTLAHADISPSTVLRSLSYLASFYVQSEGLEAAFLLATFVGSQAGTPGRVRTRATALAKTLTPKLPQQTRQRLQEEATSQSLKQMLARQSSLLES